MNRLRPFTFFPPVEPLGAAAVGRLDALAVHAQGFRGWRSTRLDANLLAECGVNLVPDAGQSPVAEQSIDGLPGGEVMWHHPPGSAGSEVVEDGVDHLSPINGNRLSAFGSAGFRLRKQRIQTIPLIVGQVGGVWPSTHGAMSSRSFRPMPDRFQNAL